jgi:hypothetical protein
MNFNVDANEMTGWAKLAQIVLGQEQQIPLIKMCLKAKQEDFILKKM